MDESRNDAQAANRRWGLRYIWLVAVGMGVVVAVNAGMYALAVGTFPGLMMENDDGAAALCIANFAAARERQSLGWETELDYRQLESGRLRLGATMSDAEGKPLDGLFVSAEFWRPTNEGFDRKVLLWETAPGKYSGELSLPLTGQWDVRLSARLGGDNYERSWRIHTE